MWNQVYDKNGKPVTDGILRFKEALRLPHQVTTKIEMLDESLDAVDGGELFTSDVTNEFPQISGAHVAQHNDLNEFTNFITDGNIDVDIDRGTRRTSELTILNPTSEFTPATQGFDSEGDWVGMVYLDRHVRIWRGLYYSGQALYVPCGTFMIDVIDVQVEQNMSQVVLTMSDRWKMLAKSYFSHARRFYKGVLYNDVISELLSDCGVTASKRTLDSLGSRDNADRKLTRDYKVEIGDSRGDLLKKWTTRWNIDIYFNPMGRLITEDRKRDRDQDIVWRYYWSDQGDGMLINLTRTFSDDNLYNHVVVVGQREINNNTTQPFFVERKNENPASKFRINRMGDRVLLIQDDDIGSVSEANKALAKAWSLRTSLSESIQIQAINNPLLEADDVIKITEKNLAKMEDAYRLRRFNIPLVSSLQTLQVNQILRSDDL